MCLIYKCVFKVYFRNKIVRTKSNIFSNIACHKIYVSVDSLCLHKHPIILKAPVTLCEVMLPSSVD